MTDQIIRLGKSVVQHGKSNNRVYLMKLSRTGFPAIKTQIKQLARENGYTKVFAKVPQWAREGFRQAGYETEAMIPNFFSGEEDAYFMACYFDESRRIPQNRQEVRQVIRRALTAEPANQQPELEGFRHGVLTPQDAEEAASVYRRVFETYPFPIHDPAYLRQTMQDNIVYFGVRNRNRVVVVASCEMDRENQNVEMTDFATLPEYRSKGFASFLLSEMEGQMRQRGILTSYTIARSLSYGMNITFAKHGYLYRGTLINNTNIAGAIESMNVWCKALVSLPSNAAN